MKFKLISFVVVLICLLCVVYAGLASIYRSEGRVISPEAQAKIEEFCDQHGIDMPKLPDFLTQ